MTTREKKPVVLTIAGFDPSGGAGIIADIRTIEQFGCAAVAAITSVTFQNAEQYFGAKHLPADSVRAQVQAMIRTLKIGAVKIGMLATAEVAREVARMIRENNLPAPVIDPVIESTSGGELMEDNAFEVLVTELLPLARVLTPNTPEAEKFGGMNIRTEDEMRQAAARIRELGARAVLVKGGHLGQRGSSPTVREGAIRMSGTSADAIDLLNDDGQVTVFRSEWIEARNVRGTGCTLSSAIAASLARGSSLKEAVTAAKTFVADQIQRANLQTEN